MSDCMTLRGPIGAALLLWAVGAAAQEVPVVLDPVTVTAQRFRQSAFDAPAAISAVTRETIEAAGPQVNLSEALNRVPGISVLNRQNYAQDLQLSIRGFGARSTFGIRGVRLIVDGIPATMPDGQGQASNIALSSAGRIEVLRGPLAQLYGNSAGGVVQVFSADPATLPTATVGAAGGQDGLFKVGTRLSTATPSYGLLVDASHFRTEGWREHSAAQRGQLNARWHTEYARGSDLSVVANVLEQPLSQDPLGLTRAQWQADPHQTAAPAIAQDARKSVRQQQLGSVIEHRFSDATVFTGRVYAGTRDLANALSTPLAAQATPTSSGGIVQFARTYAGAAAQIMHALRLDEGRSLRLTAGVEVDRMTEDRQGYINNAGVQGALKRDEHNRVDDRDAYLQLGFDISAQWSVTAGVRTSRVQFRTEDHFIAAGNPDDSGSLAYSATNPVVGIAWRAAPSLNLYANAGRGFETPTFTELAYRPVGTGLNTDLRASRSHHAEVGAKWKPAADQQLDLALFDITTHDEIVVDTNNGGRSTFKNAGRTSRSGVELSYAAPLSATLRMSLSVTALRARFDEDFVSGSGAAAVPVPAGNRLPGTPQRNAFAELVWTPAQAWPGFNAALELVHTGALYVDDANTDAAAASTVLNLRAGLVQTLGGWRFSELLRVDNATDRRYIGSVIVNEANKRFFEPALPRRWLLALTANYALR
jgi:iron complex outermembrane receptor protein